MRRLRDLSFKHKLTLLMALASFASLLLACGLFAWIEIADFRDERLADLDSLGSVVGANCVAALTFDDPRTATEVLSALANKPDVLLARVFDRQGRPFATFTKTGVTLPPLLERPPAEGRRFETSYAVLSRAIVVDGERVGSVLLVTDLSRLRAKLARYGVTVLLVLLTCAGAGLLLSSRLQETLSLPLLRLAEAARAVSEGRDSTVRVERTARDELGVLTEAFNEMLGQIGQRDTSLRAAHQSLEEQLDRLQREILEREEAERALREKDEQLRQIQKMEAIGRLAGGVAHDFNNILGVIIGYAELLLRPGGPAGPARAKVEQMLKAAHRAGNLTRQLLAFSRKQILAAHVLDLNGVSADIAQMLQRLVGEDVEVTMTPAPNLWKVKADPGQIEQVLMNLAVNARDAMSRGGNLTVETRNVQLDEDYTKTHPGVASGPYVMLAVSDTGCGMDRETQARIFEPFFTTKAPGEGTGLGLATVYGIVKQSGGSISIDSELGIGTTFTIYLPRAEEAEEERGAARATPEPVSGRETVLVVEDQDDLRELVREVLEGAGHEVLTASNGREALALTATHRKPVHLLLTDVVMPGLSGRELAARLEATHPELKVLYMSGYTDDAITRHGILRDGVPFLQKPFPPDVLARKVREVLGRADVERKEPAVAIA